MLLGAPQQEGAGAAAVVGRVDLGVDVGLPGLGAVVDDADLGGAHDPAVGVLGDEHAQLPAGMGGGRLEGDAPGSGDQEGEGCPADPRDGVRVRGVGAAEVPQENGHAEDATCGLVPDASQLTADGTESVA